MKRAFWVALALLLGIAASEAAVARHDVQLLFASKSLSDGDVALHIELQYHGTKPVSIYKSDLPWGIRDSLLLVAVCLDATKSVIPAVTYIDDPSPGTLELKPGQKVQGTILLKRRFPTLPECLREKEALIFWSYQLSPIGNEKPIVRTSGGLAIRNQH